MISDAELTFEYHLRTAGEPDLLSGENEHNAYMFRSAEEDHSLCVQDAVIDLSTRALVLSDQLSNQDAKYQMRFGVCRRTKFIWLSLRELHYSVHPERTDPLSMDEVEAGAKALNEIYINIQGTLDNFSRCLLHEFRDGGVEGIHDTQVDLFRQKFLMRECMTGLSKEVTKFSGWHAGLMKTWRNTAAHRIPLSIPPAVHTPEENQEHDALMVEWHEACRVTATKRGREFDEARAHAEQLYKRTEKIGSFIPMFTHHPNEEATKIYPTVPGDVGQMVRISRRLLSFIESRLDPGEEDP